eukprot:CAMPEP_0117446378 /NCGR_PEP_ID=MMETSP0759-20121206/6308_1 /TAXON_ID=63605 /ORGANISM="Percolomonas cosmopolitus, Strain WS" /LENGTH=308 /DNA_ID=CAMNT_0005238639 /DNA_START=66 /DNA_END=992 /DNA_ORIENTATION=+
MTKYQTALKKRASVIDLTMDDDPADHCPVTAPHPSNAPASHNSISDNPPVILVSTNTQKADQDPKEILENFHSCVELPQRERALIRRDLRKNSLLANVHQERLQRLKENPSTTSNSHSPTTTGVTRKQPSAKHQLQQYRQKKHSSFRFNKMEARGGNLFTLNNITQMQQEDRSSEFSWRAKKNNNELGKLILKHTNDYRIRRGLRALTWDNELAAIGWEHSHNMAFNGHPFSHYGFAERHKKSRFRGMAENLAMNNMSDNHSISDCALKGWIKSPGHHKNLISDHIYCGIGVVTATDGKVFMTQLFGK